MAQFGSHDGASVGSWLPVRCIVNGHDVEVVVAADRRLVSVLRDELGLTGTKVACEVGVCGACTVLVDGRPTSSCLTLAAQVDGCEVLTVEGLGEADDLAGLQDAFIEEGAYQCGFCTSGQLMNAAAVVRRSRDQTIADEEIVDQLHGNLCRCTGYYGILRAIAKVRT